MDKLQQPYTQYVLIHQALKKSFIRAALSIPLHVTVLTSPAPAPAFPFQPMLHFEERVRSYLMDALLSYSTDPYDRFSAPDAINGFWSDIQNSVAQNHGQLPSLLAPHCECTLLCHHLDSSLLPLPTSPLVERSTPYPFIGLSQLSCFQCALYFHAYTTCELGPHSQTRARGSQAHAEVFACAIPACSSASANEAILNEMGVKLKRLVGQLLAEEINARRKQSLLSSSVDSTGSGRRSPSDDEKYVDGVDELEAGLAKGLGWFA
ncbi:hypothetical protein B0H12DRAFT_337571 [Mycena haematopus]|nr:hypothetical protein B0H12DRAFT_337571 [Mycena haematopus]